MNTAKFLRPLGWLPLSLPGHGFGHWLRAAQGWSARWRARSEADAASSGDGLIELDARTLCDIGAPPDLLARAERRRQAQRDRRDELRAGGAAGDWQRW